MWTFTGQPARAFGLTVILLVGVSAGTWTGTNCGETWTEETLPRTDILYLPETACEDFTFRYAEVEIPMFPGPCGVRATIETESRQNRGGIEEGTRKHRGREEADGR
mgnify:CR=1 FL=1